VEDTLALADRAERAEHAERSDDGTLLPKTMSPSTGDRQLIAALPSLTGPDALRELEIGETIGQGGMGLVRIAEQLPMGRSVAVKTLRPDKTDPALALFLLREAWVTGALEHPNIIPIYSIGTDVDGRPMIVMKRIDGTPWSKQIHDETHTLRFHLKIFIQVCQAIDFAGSRKIIHRDLKPENVMVGQFGETYVLDWGIAVSLGDDRGGRLITQNEVHGISGTPGYMAPEMVRETGDQLSIRTDVYLLGAILHELITKQKKHQGAHLQDSLLSSLDSPPHHYDPHVPAELAQIANRAAHRVPEQRYSTAGELAKAVELFLGHESSRELVDQAEQRLSIWEAHVAAASTPDPLLVQRLFGEARFALEQALREWKDNAPAKAALQRCLEKKFEHDLARDDFESASLMLEELGSRRGDLQTRLEELRARIDQRKNELAELRRLQGDRNLSFGRRTRAFIMATSAIGTGVIPPLALLLGQTGLQGYTYFYATSALKIVLGAAIALWAKNSLFGTAVNRQLTLVSLLLLICEIAIRPFAQALGHPIEHSLLIDFGVYALVNAVVAITVDRRLTLSPAFYIGGALLSSIWLDQIYWFLGMSHFMSQLYAAAIWRPEYVTGKDANRRIVQTAENRSRSDT
jgi:serine/threonine-protein kinase